MISVGSWILGIGRSSRTTFFVPLKTTAFIVSEDMVVMVSLDVSEEIGC